MSNLVVGVGTGCAGGSGCSGSIVVGVGAGCADGGGCANGGGCSGGYCCWPLCWLCWWW